MNINTLNSIFFILGMIIVFSSPHNWITVIGAFIASLHVTFEWK